LIPAASTKPPNDGSFPGPFSRLLTCEIVDIDETISDMLM